jgi:hypothetical protein
MRRLTKKEIKQRGCVYCTRVVVRQFNHTNWRHCPYGECPFHELDKYETYRDYLKHEGLKIRLTKLFLGVEK